MQHSIDDMRIGIDARLIGETGVGRYIRNLIEQLKLQDTKNHYVIYLPEKSFADFTLPSPYWEKRLATVHWHTVQEQIIMPILFLKDNLDIVHVPYFSIPVFYPKKFIVTIHDLTILHVFTGKATRLPYPLYIFKKLGYRLMLALGLRKAEAIITPSFVTKQEIMDHFSISGSKIHVIYEGVDERISNDKLQITNKNMIKNPYFLYVGNAYPHKNLELMLLAFADFVKSVEKPYQLIFVGKDDYFYAGLKQTAGNLGLGEYARFLENVDDEALHGLYKHALALVFPSLMEGFGLPALEAASLGTPVMCSDIPIFHEILKDMPVYIDPKNRESISHGFLRVVTKRQMLVKTMKGKIVPLMKMYSWERLGKETLALYQSMGIIHTV